MKLASFSRAVTVLSTSAAALVTCFAASSCFTGSDGLLPPLDQLYFPTGVLVSPGRTTLYVVNSDFDLQYNGGTVQALALSGKGGIREQAELVAKGIADGGSPTDVCAAIGVEPNDNETLYPGPCKAAEAKTFIQASRTVGAFGGGITLVPRDDGEPGARLFVSVRGDPSVTYFDVTDDRKVEAPGFDLGQAFSPCDGGYCLECDATGDDQRCARSHRIGENIFTSQRGLLLPTEPTSLAASPTPTIASDEPSARGWRGDALVAAHQTAAEASLVVNQWPSGDTAETPFLSTPSLEYLVEALPQAPTFVAAIPPPQYAIATGIDYKPGFVVTHRAAATLSVLRYFDDANAAPPRPFLAYTDAVAITISDDNNDSRGLAFDTTARDACERTLCTSDDLDCLRGCLDEKVGFYIASRSPASLLVGTLQTKPIESVDANGDTQITGVDETLSLDESVPLPQGPAIVAVGKVIGATGELETRVFVVCFDSRFVAVYDPVLRRIETMIRTGRGPFGLAFDTGLDESGQLRSYLMLTHFTDSYLSVIDLDSRRLSYATPLLNIGPPVPPREEQ